MLLSAESLAFLRAARVSDAVRTGRDWTAGGVTLHRSEVGRLCRAGYLLGRPGDARLTVSEQGERACAVGKAPPIGTEIISRGFTSYLRGRVAWSEPNHAILIPSVRGDGVPSVYDVSRPHSGAPWKGRAAPIGHYRNHAAWPALAALLPASWGTPYASEPFTLARLREVHERLALIGARGSTDEERAADAWNGSALCQLRRRAMHSKYLAEVLRNDDAEITAAEYKDAKANVRRAIFPWGYSVPTDAQLRVATVAEVTRDLSWLRADLVAKAHAEWEPWATEQVEKWIAARAERRAARSPR